MKKLKWLLLPMICMLVILASCNSKKTIIKNQSSSDTSTVKEAYHKSTIPTLFIHGYSGGTNSFGRMIKRMEKNDLTKKELVLTITPEGELQAKGELTGKADNPSIQVLFKDNKSHEWNQAEWIKTCLNYLRETYDIKEANLVGHSMGGASAMRYLATFGDDKQLPEINKFVGIAAPFNSFVELSEGEELADVLDKGPAVQSERYIDYVNGMGKISERMKVMILAGDVKDGSLSDEAVPVADALSVVSLFKSHGNDVKEKIFYGKSAQHSQLHENIEVDKLVADFLWK